MRKWSRHSRLTLPNKRSHMAFALGERYGVRSSLMPLVRNSGQITYHYPESDSLACVQTESPLVVVELLGALDLFSGIQVVWSVDAKWSIGVATVRFFASSSALLLVRSVAAPSTRKVVGGLIHRETRSWNMCKRIETCCLIEASIDRTSETSPSWK